MGPYTLPYLLGTSAVSVPCQPRPDVLTFMRVSNRLGPRGHALVDNALVKPAVATIQRQSLTHEETVYSSLSWSQERDDHSSAEVILGVILFGRNLSIRSSLHRLEVGRYTLHFQKLTPLQSCGNHQVSSRWFLLLMPNWHVVAHFLDDSFQREDVHWILGPERGWGIVMPGGDH